MLYLYVHNKCWDHLTLLLLSFYSDEFEKSLYLVLLSFASLSQKRRKKNPLFLRLNTCETGAITTVRAPLLAFHYCLFGLLFLFPYLGLKGISMTEGYKTTSCSNNQYTTNKAKLSAHLQGTS